MYGMLFGENKNADEILAAIGLTKGDFHRFRDCYIDENGKIAVYTRGGGGNRECYELDGCDDDKHGDECVIVVQDKLREHPLYHNDEDDDFDCTYCTFYFDAPTEEVLKLRDHSLHGEKAWPAFFAVMAGWKK